MSTASSKSHDNLWWRLYTQLSSLAGAIGLATVFRDIVSWKAFFVDLIDAWQIMARPVSNFLFGWFFHLIGIPFPEILQDYLVISALLTVGIARMCAYSNKFDIVRALLDDGATKVVLTSNKFISTKAQLFLCAFTFLAWPITLLYFLWNLILVKRDQSSKHFPSVPLFFANSLLVLILPILYFLGLVMLNYVLRFTEY